MSVNVVSPSPEFVTWRGNPSSELQQRTSELEAEASVLRCFDPTLVPGLLQTRDYAHAVLDPLTNGGNLAAAVDKRLNRQQQWRASSTVTHFLLAEQALHTRIGDPEITRVQLEMLLRPLPPTVTLGVLPRPSQLLSSTTNFILYDDTLAAVETVTGSLRFTDHTSISDYLTVFDTLTAGAVFGHRRPKPSSAKPSPTTSNPRRR